MSRLIDLVGKKFGRLAVLKREANVKTTNDPRWLCRCDCGKEKIVYGSRLRNNSTKSCGCTWPEDLTGKQFGRWTVLNKADIRKNGSTTWHCCCSCGVERDIIGTALRSKQSLSCGCLGKELKYEDLTGRRFGRLLVLHRLHVPSRRGHIWACRCDCGKEKNILSGLLTGNQTKSCGCLQKEVAREVTSKRRRELHPGWKGGRARLDKGYVAVIDESKSAALIGKSKCTPYIREHKLVMQKWLGRNLLKNETVHHRNGNRLDNRIENLELWASNHPSGQRVTDLVAYAKEILSQYEPTALAPIIERPD